VIVADENVMSAKSVNAVVPLDVGVMLVSVPPPAEYVPELATSLVAVYVRCGSGKRSAVGVEGQLKGVTSAGGEIVRARASVLF
jgi:hypothetical protein